jgi:NAD(P)-dependent dehydrogenase (short-subunit alcohol dehydrogenase family)
LAVLVTSTQPRTETVAIVVGAGELGRAVSVRLASQGQVVVVDRNGERLADLPTGIGSELADASDPAAARLVVEKIADEVGRPAILVNTLGAFLLGEALATTPDQFHLMMDVNLGPALWLSQAVAPYMRAAGTGTIVHVAARPGLEPSPGTLAYSASKAALVHVTRILDVELRPLGIRVNAVAPQLIDTAFARASFPPEVLAHAVDPDAIARVIEFLVSDDAAPVSGAVIPVYGA